MMTAEREAQIRERVGGPQHLPDCMMPDGADPCKGYIAITETMKGQGLSMRSISDELRETHRFLDEARAESAEWKEACLDAREGHERLQDQIARLTAPPDNPVLNPSPPGRWATQWAGTTTAKDAPPGASAMERVRDVVHRILRKHEARGDTVHSNPKTDYEEIARAIAQAEREATARERERCLLIAACSAHTAEYVVEAIKDGSVPQ